MVATIPQIIATINPTKYYDYKSIQELNEFKALIKRDGFQKAADSAKPKAIAEHKLVYDSSAETLEPIYFFILDLMQDFRFKVDKLIDNFSSSPGSGHFSELGQRASIMQQQGTKMLGDINNVIRSVLNIIYDLKEFRIRLSQYDALKNPKLKEAAVLSLKQLWMDKVDIQKGQGSINALTAGQLGFQTLRDAFLVAKDVADVDKIDLNDRVKRILRPRILEFSDWAIQSEKELRKRYVLEKSYLASQVNALKLYSRWAKPYLRAAQQLEMKQEGMEHVPALVKTFNTIILELVLLGKQSIDPKTEAVAGNLPKDLARMNFKREYSICLLVEFNFRGIPQRVSQQSHYAFGGKAEVAFKAYVLNADEIAKLNEQMGESDINDVLRLIEGSTGENLKQMQDEIDFFLEEGEYEPEEEQHGYSSAHEDTSNPFIALIGGYESSGEKPAKEKAKGKKEEKGEWWPAKESYIEEKVLRPFGEEQAKEIVFKIFDIYKKAHGMPSYT